MRRLRQLRDLVRRNTKITITVAVAAVLIAATTITLIALTPSPTPSTPVAYTNISRNFKTCLLSTADEADQAQPVWHAIQTAATRAAINAQHITAPTGPTATLVPYLNSLIALHCQLIVTTGNAVHDALITTATSNPRTQFLNIGPQATLPNVHDLPGQPRAADITQYILTQATATH